MIAVPIVGVLLVIVVMYILVWSRASSNQRRIDRLEDRMKEKKEET